MHLEEYLYEAPSLSLSLGQWAKVKALNAWSKPMKNVFGETDFRVSVKILEGAEVGEVRTIRTRSSTTIWDTEFLAKKTDITDLEFWIQKLEKTNARGKPYNIFQISASKPSLKGI